MFLWIKNAVVRLFWFRSFTVWGNEWKTSCFSARNDSFCLLKCMASHTLFTFQNYYQTSKYHNTQPIKYTSQVSFAHTHTKATNIQWLHLPSAISWSLFKHNLLNKPELVGSQKTPSHKLLFIYHISKFYRIY